MSDCIETFVSMAERFMLSYYYVTPQDSRRIEQFRACSGDSEKMLVTQYVRGWFGKNRNTYLELAHLDADARNLSFQKWGEIIVTQGVEALPPYTKEVVDIPPNPLNHISLPPDTIRKPLNYITLGRQNIALLRVAILYDRDNAIGLVSRIVREHLLRNWDTLYKSQVEAEDFQNWM